MQSDISDFRPSPAFDCRAALSPSGNNLTLVKYVIALMIVLTHFTKLSGSDFEIPSLFMRRISLFYTISGLLAFNTLSKYSGAGFMLRRLRRLTAPYFFVVLACALGLFALSVLPAGDYFFSVGFWKYLGANLTFMNFIEPDLPGVFGASAHVYQDVNGALWTMKNTVLLLVTAPAVAWCIKRVAARSLGPVVVIVPLILVSIGCRIGLYIWSLSESAPSWYDLERLPPCQICYFYIGALVYFYLPRFKRSLAVIAALSVACMLAGDIIPYYRVVMVPFVESLVMLCAAFALDRSVLPRHLPDATYQIYLFHWPIIQLVLSLALPWHQSLVLSVSLTLVAAFGYVAVERRFFKKKKSNAPDVVVESR